MRWSTKSLYRVFNHLLFFILIFLLMLFFIFISSIIISLFIIRITINVNSRSRFIMVILKTGNCFTSIFWLIIKIKIKFTSTSSSSESEESSSCSCSNAECWHLKYKIFKEII
uniref:Candidate secreted effector n=1 Tax=Meloidogyne incognita TaxID=6306 RepID=A0A914LQZ8_MELIC